MRTKFLLVALLLSAGCVSAPKVKDVELVPAPETWTATATPAGAIGESWWEDFGEPDLVQVVETALTRNFDLRAAAARVNQAAAQARIAGADLQPTVNAGLNGQKRKQNFIGFPIPGAKPGEVLSTTITTYGVSLNVSWELDLWDRLGARARAGIADLQAVAADYSGARLSVAGQTMKAWFATAEASQQLALAEATVESFTRSTNQVRERYEAGIRSSLDLRLSLANLAGAEALLGQRRQQLDAATRQLEVLLGKYPGRELLVPETLPDTPLPIPAGLPADLIARRPDLAAAERRLAASDERYKAAGRDRLPRISLTASAGTFDRFVDKPGEWRLQHLESRLQCSTAHLPGRPVCERRRTKPRRWRTRASLIMRVRRYVPIRKSRRRLQRKSSWRNEQPISLPRPSSLARRRGCPNSGTAPVSRDSSPCSSRSGGRFRRTESGLRRDVNASRTASIFIWRWVVDSSG